MTDAGHAAIAAARKAGTWDTPARATVTPEQVAALKEQLLPYPAALGNLEAMSSSVQRSAPTRARISPRRRKPAARRSCFSWWSGWS